MVLADAALGWPSTLVLPSFGKHIDEAITQRFQTEAVIEPAMSAISKAKACFTIRPEDPEWNSFAAFCRPPRLAVLVGDPDEPGPYVIRVRLPAGSRMMPQRRVGW
jgi:hypothetical protein